MDKRDRVEAILKRATGEDPSFPHGPSVKWPKVYRGLRDDGKTKSEAAAISNAAWNKYRRWGEAGDPGPKSAAEYEATRGRKARKRKGIPLKVEKIDSAAERESAAVRIRKHGSSHDESSHGNRPNLVRAKPSTDPDRFFRSNDPDRYDWHGALNRPGLIQDAPPVVSQADYGTPRLNRKEKDLLRRWESFRRSNPFMHPGQVAMAFNRQERSRLMDLFDKTEQPWLKRVFKAADIIVVKHGSHDQLTHGNRPGLNLERKQRGALQRAFDAISGRDFDADIDHSVEDAGPLTLLAGISFANRGSDDPRAVHMLKEVVDEIASKTGHPHNFVEEALREYASQVEPPGGKVANWDGIIEDWWNTGGMFEERLRSEFVVGVPQNAGSERGEERLLQWRAGSTLIKHGSHDQLTHGNRNDATSSTPVSLFPAANAGSDIIALPNSLGIERGDMPQIPEVNQLDFLAELAAEGVSATEVSVPAASLKPMQHHLNRTKIDRAKQGIVDKIPKLTRVKSFISSDNYILDGHHRWAAYAELGRNSPAIRVDLNARELLVRAARFNHEHGVEARSIAETVAKLLATIAKHYGPGPHSGTGTPQSVHSGGTPAVATAALVKENTRLLSEWERSSHSPTHDDPEVKSAARSLFEKALVNEARISKVIAPVVEATGGEFHAFDHRVKFEGAIRSKIVRTADEGAFTIEEAAANVRDLNRYTVAWEPGDWANGYEKFRTAMAENGWSIHDHKEKNFWDPGDYYDGFNVQFTNGGSFVEVQFGTPRSLELKERSHTIYKKVREMDDTPERAKMMDEMYAIWHADRSHVPPNVARFGHPQAKGF